LWSEAKLQLNVDRTTRLHLLLIVLATFLAFGVVLIGYFIADDTWQLQFANRVLHHGEWSLVWGNFCRSYLSLPSMDFYRPLLGISYLADFAIYGTIAAGFYLTNIIMAALAGVLLYFIARALVPGVDRDRANYLALTSALLFVVSPLHCEDVCWISGRADLLAAPFFLGSILAAIYARNWSTGAINSRYYLISLAAFACSLMSKESPVILPFVVASLFVLGPSLALRPAAPAPLLKGRPADDDGESVSDGKDQRIKKRKKIKGDKARQASELEARSKKESDGEEKARPKNPVQNDAGPLAAALGAPERAVASKVDWLAFARQFFLFLAPYGAITIVYLFVRQHALGSFIGGYTGDMGEALSKWLLFRWFDPVNLIRMAFPIAKDNFILFGTVPEHTPVLPVLGTIYAAIIGLLSIRLITQKINLRVPLFILLWLTASLVPLFTLWGLDSSLHNQRVLYLYTAPMVMLLPSLVFLPRQGDRVSMSKQNLVLNSDMEDLLCEVTSWCFYALVVCLIFITSLVSFNWVLAGWQIKAIQQKTTALIENLKNGPDKKILVVRVPKDYLGAHVLMGGVNMIELLEPPFTREKISQYMVSFQRALVGPAEPVSSVRLKSELKSLHDRKAYFWEVEKSDYKVVHYDEATSNSEEETELDLATGPSQVGQAGLWYPQPSSKAEYTKSGEAAVIALHKLNDEGGDGIVIHGLDINPLDVDYVNLTLSMPHAPAACGVYLSFDDSEDAKAPYVVKPQICRMFQVLDVRPGDPLKEKALKIKVSHFGDWFSFNRIRRLKLSFSNVPAVNLSRISLSDNRHLSPDFQVEGRQSSPNGEYFCDQHPVQFSVKTSMIPGAKVCRVDVSKVNQSWDTFVSTNVHGVDSVLNRSFMIPLVDGKASFQLDPQVYAENGFYDVRVAILGEKDKFVSDWSDLITLYRPDPTGAKAPFCADY
jgi:hypothetical protein